MGSLTPTVVARSLSYLHASTGRGIPSIDLRVGQGENLALIGPNGSGKSTLLRMLATALPAKGELELFGVRPQGRVVWDLRRRIGFAGDAPVHLEELSGRENAVFFARAAGLPPGFAGKQVEALFGRFGLSAHGDEPVSAYSFGMRRKLLLVEALAHDPDLLLLDEPAVGLDATSRATLREVLSERVDRGGSVVVATNDLRGVADLADRVTFLLDGDVAAEGTPAQLMALVAGITELEIIHDGTAPSDLVPPEGVALRMRPGVVRAESRVGSAPLPAILQDLLSAGVRVRSVSVREPDLGDAFEALTGRRLKSTAGPGGSSETHRPRHREPSEGRR